MSDADVLDWCYVCGCRLTDAEVLIYNCFMSKRGCRDDKTDKFILAIIREYGLKVDGNVLTDFDRIEMDEGRWHPDMWMVCLHYDVKCGGFGKSAEMLGWNGV